MTVLRRNDESRVLGRTSVANAGFHFLVVAMTWNFSVFARARQLFGNRHSAQECFCWHEKVMRRPHWEIPWICVSLVKTSSSALLQLDSNVTGEPLLSA